MDFIDDIVHEIAHSIEKKYVNEISMAMVLLRTRVQKKRKEII